MSLSHCDMNMIARASACARDAAMRVEQSTHNETKTDQTCCRDSEGQREPSLCSLYVAPGSVNVNPHDEMNILTMNTNDYGVPAPVDESMAAVNETCLPGSDTSTSAGLAQAPGAPTSVLGSVHLSEPEGAYRTVRPYDTKKNGPSESAVLSGVPVGAGEGMFAAPSEADPQETQGGPPFVPSFANDFF